MADEPGDRDFLDTNLPENDASQVFAKILP